MHTIIRYVLLTALRDRLFIVLLVGMLLATGISAALANTSLVEQDMMRLVFTAGVARILVNVGMIVFVAFHVRSAFDTKEIDVILSRPISRATLVVSYWAGFAVVALALSALASLVVYLLSPNLVGFVLWATSLAAEAVLVVGIALFAALIVRSAVATVMICLGFYTLARMMAYFLITIQSRLLFRENILNDITRFIIKGVALFIPRLDFFADSSWLIYAADNVSEVAMLFATQVLVYVPVLLLAAIVDFRKKQF